MKKNYITPVTHLFVLNTPLCLQPGAVSVNNYKEEDSQQVGETEPAKKRNMWSE